MRLINRIIDFTISDTNWHSLTEYIPVATLKRIQIRNSSGAMQMRDSENPTKTEDYAQNELWWHDSTDPKINVSIANMQIKGGNGDRYRGEYVEGVQP